MLLTSQVYGDLNLLSIISKRHLDKQRRPRSDASELDVKSEPTEFSFKAAIEKKNEPR